MDTSSSVIYGGRDLYESHPNVCWRLAILLVLVKSTRDTVDDSITS